MGAVAKRFLSRRATAAERHSRFDRKFISVGVHQFHFALHDVGTVLDCLDCYHVRSLNVIPTEVEESLTVFWPWFDQKYLEMSRLRST